MARGAARHARGRAAVQHRRAARTDAAQSHRARQHRGGGARSWPRGRAAHARPARQLGRRGARADRARRRASLRVVGGRQAGGDLARRQRTARPRRLDRLGVRLEWRSRRALARARALSRHRAVAIAAGDDRLARCEARGGRPVDDHRRDPGAHRDRARPLGALGRRARRAVRRRGGRAARLRAGLRRRHPAVARPRQLRRLAALGQHRGADRAPCATRLPRSAAAHRSRMRRRA